MWFGRLFDVMCTADFKQLAVSIVGNKELIRHPDRPTARLCAVYKDNLSFFASHPLESVLRFAANKNIKSKDLSIEFML